MRPSRSRPVSGTGLIAAAALCVVGVLVSCTETDSSTPVAEVLQLDGVIWVDVALTPDSGPPDAPVKIEARVVGPADLELLVDLLARVAL